jgi:hypothetical protein
VYVQRKTWLPVRPLSSPKGIGDYAGGYASTDNPNQCTYWVLWNGRYWPTHAPCEYRPVESGGQWGYVSNLGGVDKRLQRRGLGACDPAIFDLSTCGQDPLLGCQTTAGVSVPCPVGTSADVTAAAGGRSWLPWILGGVAGLVVLKAIGGRR